MAVDLWATMLIRALGYEAASVDDNEVRAGSNYVGLLWMAYWVPPTVAKLGRTFSLRTQPEHYSDKHLLNLQCAGAGSGLTDVVRA